MLLLFKTKIDEINTPFKTKPSENHTLSGCTSLQPRPQGLLLVQNGGRRNPWPRLLKYSKNRGVFCHVTHNEMAFSQVLSSVWRPCLFSAIGNRCLNETKTFRRVYLKKFKPIFGATSAALARGFSDRYFE